MLKKYYDYTKITYFKEVKLASHISQKSQIQLFNGHRKKLSYMRMR